MGRGKSTIVRCALHLMHLASDLVGDDWLSKWIRAGLLRGFGARLGPGSDIHGGSYFTAPSNFTTGRNCFVNRNCYLDLAGPVVLGDEVVIGHGATIITTEHEIHNPRRRAGTITTQGVTVGDGSWLCASVTVLPGVTIGAGSIIAAGAIVTRDIPENVLAGGVPARVMRMLSDDVPQAPARRVRDGRTGSDAVLRANEPTT